jgi:6-pyruvoyltetrahydropterin/6-carboxytetrahydropterin synthase
VLLPTNNPRLILKESGDRMAVDYLGAERFIFPRSNVSLLPIANTTAEMLAEYLALRVRDDLQAEGLTLLTALEVEVEESKGQSAYCKLAIDR